METEGSSPSRLTQGCRIKTSGFQVRHVSQLRAPRPERKGRHIFSSLSPQVLRTSPGSQVTDGPLGDGVGACRPRGKGPQRPLLPGLHEPSALAVSLGPRAGRWACLLLLSRMPVRPSQSHVATRTPTVSKRAGKTRFASAGPGRSAAEPSQRRAPSLRAGRAGPEPGPWVCIAHVLHNCDPRVLLSPRLCCSWSHPYEFQWCP